MAKRYLEVKPVEAKRNWNPVAQRDWGKRRTVTALWIRQNFINTPFELPEEWKIVEYESVPMAYYPSWQIGSLVTWKLAPADIYKLRPTTSSLVDAKIMDEDDGQFPLGVIHSIVQREHIVVVGWYGIDGCEAAPAPVIVPPAPANATPAMQALHRDLYGQDATMLAEERVYGITPYGPVDPTAYMFNGQVFHTRAEAIEWARRTDTRTRVQIHEAIRREVAAIEGTQAEFRTNLQDTRLRINGQDVGTVQGISINDGSSPPPATASIYSTPVFERQRAQAEAEMHGASEQAVDALFDEAGNLNRAYIDDTLAEAERISREPEAMARLGQAFAGNARLRPPGLFIMSRIGCATDAPPMPVSIRHAHIAPERIYMAGQQAPVFANPGSIETQVEFVGGRGIQLAPGDVVTVNSQGQIERYTSDPVNIPIGTVTRVEHNQENRSVTSSVTVRMNNSLDYEVGQVQVSETFLSMAAGEDPAPRRRRSRKKPKDILPEPVAVPQAASKPDFWQLVQEHRRSGKGGSK